MAEKVNLFDSSESESDSASTELKVNKNYADRYSNWRRKEEMQKLKDICKDDGSSSSSESDEFSPTEEDHKAFLRTYSLLLANDPKVNDENYKFHADSQQTDRKKSLKDKKAKPVFHKQYEKKFGLVKNGEVSEDDEEHIPNKGPTNDEELEQIKKEFEAVDVSDDEFLQLNTETVKEVDEAEDADYVQWLKGEEKEVADDIKDMTHLRKRWADPDLSEKDRFLRDYMLNQGYLKEEKAAEVSTYVADNVSEEEDEIEKQDDFERKYNFRFEEPDAEFIRHYPRTIGDSLRRADNKRKLKRDDYAERKKKEKQQKREELKRLKAVFREEKLAKWKEVIGEDEVDLDENFIDSDFDPDKHDQKMKDLFNDDYFAVEEERKPQFEFDEEIDSENWDHWVSRKNKTDPADEDNNIEVIEPTVPQDSDSEEDEKTDPKLKFQNEMIESIAGKKRIKKKSLFAKTIAKPKPTFDPAGKSFNDYLDEYYRLDFEDVIGDMPVRFKYRNVVANNFGLSMDEILAADDKDLNRWCSVKKTCQYRNNDEELYDIQAYQKKAQNDYTKQKILSSLYAEPNTVVGEQDNLKKTKNKKKKKAICENSDQTFGTSPKCKKKKITMDSNQKHFDFRSHDMTGAATETAVTRLTQHNAGIEPIIKKRKSNKRKSNEIASLDHNIVFYDDHCSQDINEQATETDVKLTHHNTNIEPIIKKRKGNKRKSNEISNLEHSNDHGYQVNTNNEVKSAEKVESPTPQNTKRKKKKGKRKTHETSVVQSYNDHANEDLELNSSRSLSDAPKKKKSRKTIEDNSNALSSVYKKEQGMNSMVNDKALSSKRNRKRNNASQRNFSSKNQSSKGSMVDKRLAISDERLKAYGINPKKFKSSIVHSGNFKH